MLHQNVFTLLVHLRKPARSPVAKSRSSAFTLVEVVLAIGVISFGFIAIFGLLPTGLHVFRQSVDTTVGSQIAQQIINDAQQADFDQLLLVADQPESASYKIFSLWEPDPTNRKANNTGRKPVRYFDEQGLELSSDQKSKAIYYVNTRIMVSTTLPQNKAQQGIGLPVVNPSLITVTVQVANNPSGRQLALSPGASDDYAGAPQRNLWSGSYQGDTNTSLVPYLVYSALVARNQ